MNTYAIDTILNLLRATEMSPSFATLRGSGRMHHFIVTPYKAEPSSFTETEAILPIPRGFLGKDGIPTGLAAALYADRLAKDLGLGMACTEKGSPSLVVQREDGLGGHLYRLLRARVVYVLSTLEITSRQTGVIISGSKKEVRALMMRQDTAREELDASRIVFNAWVKSLSDATSAYDKKSANDILAANRRERDMPAAYKELMERMIRARRGV